jgi:hypothetical protein
MVVPVAIWMINDTPVLKEVPAKRGQEQGDGNGDDR